MTASDARGEEEDPARVQDPDDSWFRELLTSSPLASRRDRQARSETMAKSLEGMARSLREGQDLGSDEVAALAPGDGSLARAALAAWQCLQVWLSPHPSIHREFPLGRIGPYLIQQQVGRGGQGRIFGAVDSRSGRLVALKVLRGFESRPEAARERLRREFALLSRIRDRGICRVFEFDVDSDLGCEYIAMELVKGRSLEEMLEKERTQANGGDCSTRCLPIGDEQGESSAVERWLSVFESLAHALHAAHSAGVIHRDVKPGNIMVTPDLEPVLLDFGLARDLTPERSNLTASKESVGTPRYMAPEQRDTSASLVGPWSDVYSLATILFEVLTLRHPADVFQGEPDLTLLPLGAGRKLKPLLRHAPKDLVNVLLVALTPEPRARYQSAHDFAVDLRSVRTGELIHARPTPLQIRVQRWIVKRPLVVFGLLLGVIFLSGALVHRQRLLEEVASSLEVSRAEKARADIQRANALLREAQLEAQRGRWTRALQRCTDAETSCSSPALQVELAMLRLDAYLATMQMEAADREIATLERLEKPPGSRARIDLVLGDLARSRLRDRNGGLDLIRRALESNELPPADQAYAEALLAEGIADCMAKLRQARTFDAGHRRATALLGFLLSAFGPAAELRELSEQYAAVSPEDPKAAILCAFSDARNGLPERGRARLKGLSGSSEQGRAVVSSEVAILEFVYDLSLKFFQPEFIERVHLDGPTPKDVNSVIAASLRLISIAGEARKASSQRGSELLRIALPRSLLNLAQDALHVSKSESNRALQLLRRLLFVVPELRELEEAPTGSRDPKATLDLHGRPPVLLLLHGVAATSSLRGEEAVARYRELREKLTGTEWERFALLLEAHQQANAELALAFSAVGTRPRVRNPASDLVARVLASGPLTNWHLRLCGELAAILGSETDALDAQARLSARGDHAGVHGISAISALLSGDRDAGQKALEAFRAAGGTSMRVDLVKQVKRK